MLFISHRKTDEEFAFEVKRRALDQGYSAEQLFLDSDGGINPGDEWRKKLYDSLDKSRAMIVLCSPNWHTSKWCPVELGYAKATAMAIFPMLIEKCDLGSTLDPTQAIDLSMANDEQTRDAAFTKLWEALTKKHLGPKDIPPWPPVGEMDDCPFPGLSAFGEKFAPVYFGREVERDLIIAELTEMRKHCVPRLLLITGDSGSGKSSLLRAGVWPWLNNGLEAQSWLPLPILRFNLSSENHTLLGQLADKLAAQFPANSRPEWNKLRDDFESIDAQQAARAFADQIGHLNQACDCTERTIVILIDQFEELLTTTDRPSAEKFLAFLQPLLSGSDRRLLVVGTMRSDYLNVYERHVHAVKLPFYKPFALPPFPWSRVADLINKPAARVGKTFTSELVEELKKAAPENDPLPLLAFTLESLYRKHKAEKTITVGHYSAMGQMDGAIREAVARALPKSLTPAKEKTLRLCFVVHLAEVNEKDKVVRKPALWSKLRAECPLLENFVNERLLHITGDGESAMVEVSHEAIFRCWDQLKAWLEAERNNLRLRYKLEHTVREWNESITPENPSGDEDLFFTMAQLEAIDVWKPNVQLLPSEEAFLNASREKRLSDNQRTIEAAAQRETDAIRFAKRLKLALLGTTVIALVAVVLGITAWFQRSVAIEKTVIANAATEKAEKASGAADRAKVTAEENARAARYSASRALSVLAKNESERAPQRGLLLSLEALKINMREHEPPSLETQEALRFTMRRAGGCVLSMDEELTTEEQSKVVVDMSKDGRWIAVSTPTRVRLWNTTDLDSSKNPVDLPSASSPIRFSPNSLWLITSSSERKVCAWELSQENPADHCQELSRQLANVDEIEISPLSKWLVVGTVADSNTEMEFHVWDLEEEYPTIKFVKNDTISVSSYKGKFAPMISFSPDHQWLVTSAWVANGNRINTTEPRLWHLAAGAPFPSEFHALEGHNAPVSHAVFSSDSKWLATCCNVNDSHGVAADFSIRMWDLSAGIPKSSKFVLNRHTGVVGDLAFGPESHWLVSGAADSTVRIWDLEQLDPNANPVLLEHNGPISALIVPRNAVPNATIWLAALSGDTMRFWDFHKTTSGDKTAVQIDPVKGRMIAACSDNQWLMTCCPDSPNLATVWNLASESPLKHTQPLNGHEGKIQCAVFSADDRWIVTGSSDRTARLWTRATREFGTNPLVYWGDLHVFSPDSRWLITDYKLESNTNDGTLRLWDLENLKLPPQPIILEHPSTKDAVFSPDNRWLVASGYDREISIWDLTALDKKPRSHVCKTNPSSLAISPDSPTLMYGEAGGEIHRVNLESLHDSVSHAIQPHKEPVSNLVISPDRLDGKLLSFSDNRLFFLTVKSNAQEIFVYRSWDAATRNPSISGSLPVFQVTEQERANISGNGRWLVTSERARATDEMATEDIFYTAQLWDLNLDAALALAIKTAGRDLTAKEWTNYLGEQPYEHTREEMSKLIDPPR